MPRILSWIDYVLFVAMILMSTLIGIYYGFYKNQSSAKEYLLGGKAMNVLAVSLSIISSCISGIPLLGLPAETYLFGITAALMIFSICVLATAFYYLYIPVFRELEVISMYEYFQLRFDRKLRILTSILYAIQILLHLAVVVYAPSLVLEQVTGTSARILSPVLCGICILYTSLGGIKAIVWIDALQFVFMMGSVLVVVIIGTIRIGGIGNVWRVASENGRLAINFDFDLSLRDSFWTSTIGWLVLMLNITFLNQATIQRYMSLSSCKDIKRTGWIAAIGLIISYSFIFFTGFAMYARYFDCDPLTSKKINKADQLLPFYIMDVAQDIPGITGLFISGMLSAALSTMSTLMNCLAATAYEDFIKPLFKKDVTDRTTIIILKTLVITIGTVSIALVYVIERLGNILPLTITLVGLTGGPISGILTVGILLPMVNSIGVFTGGVVSMIIMCWIAIGGQFYRTEFPYSPLQLSIANCPGYANISNTINSTQVRSPDNDGFFLFKISQNYYSLMGFLMAAILSIVVSVLTKRKNKIVRRDCISPLMRFLLPNDDLYLRVERDEK